MIPIMIEAHEDEMFYSYICRLAEANGCNLKNFVGRMLLGKRNSRTVAHTHWNYDGWGLWVPFFISAPINDKVGFFLSHSFYSFQAVFLTQNRQGMVVDSLLNREHARGTKKYFSIVSELRYCATCMAEDIKSFGHSYLRRAHQLPGVTVCHEHHEPLKNFGSGKTIDATPDAVEYAAFAKNLLNATLQTDIAAVQHAAMEHAVLTVTQVLGNPFLQGKNFFSTKYIHVPDIIRILILVFGTVDKLSSCLTQDTGLAARFIDRAKAGYAVYQPFNYTVIEMRHEQCGTEFFTTPAGFLGGRSCPACAGHINRIIKENTVLSFEDEVAALVGNEYTVTGKYKGRNFPVEIRHNACGHTQPYLAKHFLSGSRCHQCTKIISVNKFPEIVSYMTNGQYRVTRIISQNLYEITETSGAAIEISIPHFLQELLRPTPSDVLPTTIKNLRKDWDSNIWSMEEKPSRISKKDLLVRISSLYGPDSLIFMEDLRQYFQGNYYKLLKSGVMGLIKAGKLFRVETGIYSLKPLQVTPMGMLKEKYLVRNGKRIGIYDSKSLAYEMGMAKEKPGTLYIMTNKESQPHGRTRTINGISVHIRGNNITINDDNYLYIMVLEAIKYCWHYDSGYNYRIPQFIKKYDLSIDRFLSLLPYYTENVQKQFATMWKRKIS